MKRKQVAILLLIMLISALGLLHFIHSTLKNSSAQTIQPMDSVCEESAELLEASPIASIEPKTSASPTPSSSEENKDINVYATITIQTDKKTRTFDIYPDVDEATLKKHIGHLPSSADPGEAGICVLMGHRDRELKILKYAEVGNVIIIEKNGIDYRFVVTRIEIQDDDEALVFPVTNRAGLAIVTCYPFDFLGAAPQRMIVYCDLKSQ